MNFENFIQVEKEYHKKPSPRETRGFSHAGIALAPRGTRATRNAV